MNKVETKGKNVESLMAKVESIKGINQLSFASKTTFIGFLRNFYNAWGRPEKHEVKKVKLEKDKANGVYLRVDCSKGEWYHVKSPITWY
jgi:hypothetical protein